MNVAQIGEHKIGISHILIDVVEIGQQQLSPTIELVKRFL